MLFFDLGWIWYLEPTSGKRAKVLRRLPVKDGGSQPFYIHGTIAQQWGF
jgi:hypothetical protein